MYETSYKIISYLIQKIVFKKHLTTLLPYIALCILKNPQITSLTGYTVGTECPFITKTEEVTDINKGRKQNLNSVFDSPQCPAVGDGDPTVGMEAPQWGWRPRSGDGGSAVGDGGAAVGDGDQALGLGV